MSLGLAVAHQNAIYLAIESEGLQSGVLASKLISLQHQPEFMLLVTGGLDHWRFVCENYRSQPTAQEACAEIVRLLNDCTTPNNQAFCLMCGFEGGRPICFRINRSKGEPATSWIVVSLDTVQPIGSGEHVTAAKLSAESAIGKGVPAAQALCEAIKSRIPGNDVRGPVEMYILRIP